MLYDAADIVEKETNGQQVLWIDYNGHRRDGKLMRRPLSELLAPVSAP